MSLFTEHDKHLHMAAGAAISIAVCLIVLVTGYRDYAPILGIGMAFVAGVAKEVYDVVIMKSVFDPLDVVATVIGGVPVLGALFFL